MVTSKRGGFHVSAGTVGELQDLLCLLGPDDECFALTTLIMTGTRETYDIGCKAKTDGSREKNGSRY